MSTTAVGYEVPTSDIVEQIQRTVTDFEKGKKYVLSEISPIIKSGIYYSKQCRGGLYDVIKGEDFLQEWITKRSLKGKITGYCTVIRANHYALVAEIYTETSERFYCILASTSSGTTMHKHNIVNGSFGGDVYTIDKVKLDLTPYIF